MLAQAPNSRPSPPLPVLPLSDVSLGPVVMADDPCEAAFAGADPTGPRKYYRARYYDSKLGRFVSEDPIGFQGGMNFYAYVYDNPVRYRDPSGLIGKSDFESFRPKPKPQPKDPFWDEFGGGAGAMWSNYNQMTTANTIGADRFFHCMANCQAAQQGPGGRFASHVISYGRELYGMIKGDPWSDMQGDMAANSCGRNAGNRSCTDVCRPWLPPHLPPGGPW